MQNLQYIHILVAEDNIINQMLIVKMLSALGCKADVVENGALAIEACRLQAYDLIFMDYQMPETDGVEAARSIKQNCSLQQQPVIILMTANLLVNDDYLNHPGVLDDFLKKPFTIQEMSGKIEKWQSKYAAIASKDQ